MSDGLSRLLDGVRPAGALFDRSYMAPPWSLRFDTGAPLTLLTMLQGGAWLRDAAAEPIRLEPRDVAIVLGAEPYTVSDGRDTAPRFHVGPAGGPLALGARGDDPGGEAVLLQGTFDVSGSVCDRVLRGVPRAVVVRAEELPAPIVELVVAELGGARAGRQAVLDRLLDLLLVTTLREWLDRPGSGAPAWHHAQSDPIVGAALELIHEGPAVPWTVAELAGRVAVSRAAFARRFTELVGEPPMSYVACWRLCLAADLLRQTTDTVDAIARRVGYSNASALSVAFERTYGIRPSAHRAGQETVAS